MQWTWQTTVYSNLQLTFVGHLRTGLQVHFAASFGSDFIDLIAQVVATVLSATQAEPFLKGLFWIAPIGFTGIFFIQQRVNEEMNGALMRALHELVHISGKRHKENVNSESSQWVSHRSGLKEFRCGVRMKWPQDPVLDCMSHFRRHLWQQPLTYL